jgi:hypothetical protein
LNGIVTQRARFFNTLNALPESTVTLIADLVETNPLPDDCFNRLRARLLSAHQKTDLQRVNEILEMPTLGAQKPSELLAEMLRICPRGEEDSIFFKCTYLNKLPRELRILLSDVVWADKQAFGTRADQFWAHNNKLAHDTVAVVSVAQEEDEEWVAAVRNYNASRGAQRGGQSSGGQRGKRGGQGGRPSGQPSASLSKKDQKELGWCNKHVKFGEDAYSCTKPCSYQGN